MYGCLKLTTEWSISSSTLVLENLFLYRFVNEIIFYKIASSGWSFSWRRMMRRHGITRTPGWQQVTDCGSDQGRECQGVEGSPAQKQGQPWAVSSVAGAGAGVQRGAWAWPGTHNTLSQNKRVKLKLWYTGTHWSSETRWSKIRGSSTTGKAEPRPQGNKGWKEVRIQLLKKTRRREPRGTRRRNTDLDHLGYYSLYLLEDFVQVRNNITHSASRSSSLEAGTWGHRLWWQGGSGKAKAPEHSVWSWPDDKDLNVPAWYRELGCLRWHQGKLGTDQGALSDM